MLPCSACRASAADRCYAAGLASVLAGARPPQLLILEEPTNHLDIEFDRGGPTQAFAPTMARCWWSATTSGFSVAIAITRRLEL